MVGLELTGFVEMHGRGRDDFSCRSFSTVCAVRSFYSFHPSLLPSQHLPSRRINCLKRKQKSTHPYILLASFCFVSWQKLPCLPAGSETTTHTTTTTTTRPTTLLFLPVTIPNPARYGKRSGGYFWKNQERVLLLLLLRRSGRTFVG
ncbi:hypothetical protein K440DRAFT_7561 [Wilcoxina mikolae CBS 423.85]|nr:hypothetical protein K440DRAFT_7561 [Wilcoxina mikolae CBS 423.85]